eukprot:1186822-Prorocentrum_minimum.AAC.4
MLVTHSPAFDQGKRIESSVRVVNNACGAATNMHPVCGTKWNWSTHPMARPPKRRLKRFTRSSEVMSVPVPSPYKTRALAKLASQSLLMVHTAMKSVAIHMEEYMIVFRLHLLSKRSFWFGNTQCTTATFSRLAR